MEDELSNLKFFWRDPGPGGAEESCRPSLDQSHIVIDLASYFHLEMPENVTGTVPKYQAKLELNFLARAQWKTASSSPT